MKILTVSVTEQEQNRTVAAVLRDIYDVSESYLRRLKRRHGALLLNGEPVYTTAIVQAGDVVAFDPSDGEKMPIRPIPYPLSAAYEDEWLIVIDKPANLGVHPARDPGEPTVENALSATFSGTDNPHPVSRLDKGTTGLLCVAKSGFVHARMKTVQHAGAFQKSYLAIVCGVPEKKSFTIDAPIGPFPGSTYRRAVRPEGAESKSVCEVLKSENGLSLVSLTPLSGRTHQLRVHMAYAGFPLLGDWLYGERSALIDRPALHAEKLSFFHPMTGETVSLFAPLPEDMARLF